MKPTQYILSLNTLYRLYSKNLPKCEYEYLISLIDYYNSKNDLNNSEAKKAETKCKEEWKIYFVNLIEKIKKESIKYSDIIKEEEKIFNKIVYRIENEDIPLGEYENEWDKLDNIFRKISSKVNGEKRNFKRNWKGHILSLVIGIFATLITTWIIKIILK